MYEKMMEEINRRHEMELLDQHFPGKSCSNTRCENLCRNVCAAAIRLRMSPEELVDHTIQKEIVPHCGCEKSLALSDKKSNSQNYPNKGKPIPGCRFGYTYGSHPPKTDDQLAAQKKYSLTSKKNAHGQKAENESKSSSQVKELFFREKDSPGKYGNFGGGLTFSGIDDLIEQIENSKIPLHGLDKLIIVNHSGIDDFYNMGNSDNLRYISDEQIRKLKKFLHSKSIVDVRMCAAASGKNGEKTAQKLADKLGCQVIVYAGPVSPSGSRPLINLTPDDVPWYERILPDSKPRKFFPRIDKK